jgi:hypothetical protein
MDLRVRSATDQVEQCLCRGIAAYSLIISMIHVM